MKYHSNLDAIISLKRIHKTYSDKHSIIEVLRDAALEIKMGEIVGFFGPSGSGKTTLLNIIGLIDKPTRGEYLFDGSEISQKNNRELYKIRRRNFSFILQRRNLFESFTVRENFVASLFYKSGQTKHVNESIDRITCNFQLDEMINTRVKHLSGGQQQVVAIARSFLTNSRIILADEPTSSLDSARAHEMMTLLRNESQLENKTVIVVTHDPSLLQYFDSYYQFQCGRISKVLKHDSV